MPVKAREAEPIAAGNRAHVRGPFIHQHHVQDHEQRSPCREVEEPGDIAFECQRPGLGQQEQREEHRKQRVEEHGQHDIEERHPLHRVAGDRTIGPLGLNVGAGLGVDIDIARAARAAIVHGLAHRVDRQRLLEDLGRIRETPVRY
jgi:hypothetical protein